MSPVWGKRRPKIVVMEEVAWPKSGLHVSGSMCPLTCCKATHAFGVFLYIKSVVGIVLALGFCVALLDLDHTDHQSRLTSLLLMESQSSKCGIDFAFLVFKLSIECSKDSMCWTVGYEYLWVGAVHTVSYINLRSRVASPPISFKLAQCDCRDQP